MVAEKVLSDEKYWEHEIGSVSLDDLEDQSRQDATIYIFTPDKGVEPYSIQLVLPGGPARGSIILRPYQVVVLCGLLEAARHEVESRNSKL